MEGPTEEPVDATSVRVKDAARVLAERFDR
jgi:hypothetical protein